MKFNARPVGRGTGRDIEILLLPRCLSSSPQLDEHADVRAACENGFGIPRRRRKMPGLARFSTTGVVQSFGTGAVSADEAAAKDVLEKEGGSSFGK